MTYPTLGYFNYAATREFSLAFFVVWDDLHSKSKINKYKASEAKDSTISNNKITNK